MPGLLLLLLPARAGYGDQGSDGLPRYADRELHLWTNAARVDPSAFEAEYNAGGCSYDDFSSSEQTPKAPLYYSRALNEAAAYHTADMADSGTFSHSSSDGTSFGERLAAFYPESAYVGENIAWGYGSSWNAVFSGWMCSTDGHRANIMSADYTELGTGAERDYYTQDFGAGAADADVPVAMAVHSPERPTAEVVIYADWQDADPPTVLEAVVDGAPHALDLLWGDEEQGIYAVELDMDDLAAGCHAWTVGWVTAAGVEGTFPEEGSYLFGDDCESEWVDEQMCVTGRNCRSAEELAADILLVGCSVSPTPGLMAAFGAAIGLSGRRRMRIGAR